VVSQTQAVELETDPRFPSGPWIGFFLQKEVPGRHQMELRLTFCQGRLTGEGRDWVGRFSMRGRYNLADGKCHWTKRYVGRHDVYYEGYNEGKGIWGVWEFSDTVHTVASRGGFRIWPEGMADPTGEHLTEEADLPVMVDSLETSEALAGVANL
jgi:hypothetical protein